MELTNEDKLVVVWTSADKEVAVNMVFMYTLNSKLRGWWQEVELIVWGPSSKLLSQDKELQEYLGKIKEAGIHVSACKACADNYGVADTLTNLGLEVKYMGEPLTQYLKTCKVITF